MSDFIDCDPGVLVPLNSTIDEMATTIEGALTSRGYQVIRKCKEAVSLFGTITNYSNAFDLNPRSAAGANESLPRNLGFRAASAFTPTVMWLQAPLHPGDTGHLTASPKDFELQYSDNGTDWTTLQSWTDQPDRMAYENFKYTITGAGAHEWWRLNITAKGTSGTYLGVNRLVLEDANHLTYGSTIYFDVIPPAGQTIGNSVGFEYCRVSFGATTISFSPRVELLIDLPVHYTFSSPVAGAVTLSVTISGVTVSYSGSAGDSAKKNLLGLFAALKDSTDSNFTGMSWHNIGDGNIYAIQNTPQPSAVISSSNITANTDNHFAKAGPQFCAFTDPTTISADLTSGFIYYLQVNARGFTIATKLNSGFYGPVHVCWSTNADAVSYVPPQTSPTMPGMVPVELVVGTDDSEAAGSTGTGRLSHVWGCQDGAVPTPNNPEYNSVGTGSHPFTSHLPPRNITDLNAGNIYLANRVVQALGAGLFNSSIYPDGGEDFKVHKMTVAPKWDLLNIYGGRIRVFTPTMSDLDWYRYNGTLANEQIVMVGSTDFETTVSTTCLSGDSTVYVGDTTGFPASGWIIIGGEAIYYTWKTASSFTGCTRGQKSTLASKHYSGEKVLVGSFFIKINTGLVYCGYEEPS